MKDNVEVVDFGTHRAYLDHETGRGGLLLPDPATDLRLGAVELYDEGVDGFVILADSLHAADWDHATIALFRMQWRLKRGPTELDDYECVADADGRELMVLGCTYGPGVSCGTDPLVRVLAAAGFQS